MSKKIRVGVIYGGKSGEHRVSVQTAFSVINAFDFEKYEIIPFYITPSGSWRCGGRIEAPVSDKEQLLLKSDDALPETNSTPVAVAPLFGRGRGQVRLHGQAGDESGGEESAIDIAFPLLHGTYGEDGTIQGLFEMAGIPYVGAGVLASAVGMDKAMMKTAFAQAGLPQCVYRHFTAAQWKKERDELLLEIEISLGYPCFVKPANLGSSVGISKARNREELIAAVNEAFRYDRKVVVEEFVEAREIEVSILGNDEPRASVCGEVVSSNEFYDYRAKYVDGKSQLIIPADLPPEKAEEIRSMAIRAFRAIDCSGLARVDFFLRKADGQVLINEINTMPGFTPFSMYPLLWKESGLSYRQLLDELLRLAVERYEAKKQLHYGFDEP